MVGFGILDGMIILTLAITSRIIYGSVLAFLTLTANMSWKYILRERKNNNEKVLTIILDVCMVPGGLRGGKGR